MITVDFIADAIDSHASLRSFYANVLRNISLFSFTFLSFLSFFFFFFFFFLQSLLSISFATAIRFID